MIGLLLFPPYLCCSAPCSPASMGTEVIHAWFLAQSEFPDSTRSTLLLLVLPIQLPALGNADHLNDETVWRNIRMNQRTWSPLDDVAELFIGSSLRGVTEWRHSGRFNVFLVKIARVLGLLLGLQLRTQHPSMFLLTVLLEYPKQKVRIEVSRALELHTCQMQSKRGGLTLQEEQHRSLKC